VLATTPAPILHAPVVAKRLTPLSREQRWSFACRQVNPCNEGFSGVLGDTCTWLYTCNVGNEENGDLGLKPKCAGDMSLLTSSRVAGFLRFRSTMIVKHVL
jgi:hypothetical protein